MSSSVSYVKPSRNDGIVILSRILFDLVLLLSILSGEFISVGKFFCLTGVYDCVFFYYIYYGSTSWSSCCLFTDLAFLLGSKPSNRCLNSFFLHSSIILRSKGWKPTRCNVSQSNNVLTCLSYGLELDSDGATFTSRSHGRSLWSIIMSKPYISKH